MATWTSISEALRAFPGRPRRLARCCLRAGLVASLLPAIDAEAGGDRGAQLVAVCAACHQLDGRGRPSIVGLPVNDLVSAMWVFRSDERSNAMMHAVSLSFSDDEIAIIAERLSRMRQQPKP